MTRYWGIRTSKEQHELISGWLGKGLLRQGWGWEDLREMGREVEAGTAGEEVTSVWRNTKRMLEVRKGDVILTPHQLERGANGVWRAMGEYEFDPLPDVWGKGEPDFGHVLRVEPIGIIDHHSAKVNSSLRRALTTGFRRRMRQLDDYGDQIETLLKDPDAALPSDAVEHFAVVRDKARNALGEALIAQYGNADFEKPVEAMLNVLYPDAVARTAGPAELGRDFVVEESDRLGLSRTVIIQVKSWSGSIGEAALRHGLDQLERGVEAQGGSADMAVLLTLADDLPRDADLRIEAYERRLGTPIRILLKHETLDLMLDQIGDMKI